MVRLKVHDKQGAWFEYHNFNSSMVRLKAQKQHLINAGLNPFQFLDGAIKRRIWKHRNGIVIIFQFLDGAIKSYGHANGWSSNYYFNSSMVRLKVIQIACTWFPFSNFNSSMVRLKDTFLSDGMSISFDFNSSMVRLKVPKWSVAQVNAAYFNSSMVRLKGKEIRRRRDSTLVISIPRWCD